MKIFKDFVTILLVALSLTFLISDFFLLKKLNIVNQRYSSLNVLYQNKAKENGILQKRIDINKQEFNLSSSLVSTSSDTTTLGKLVHKGISYILYIPNGICSACVDSVLVKLTGIQERLNSKSFILISLESPRNLFDQKRMLQAGYSFYSAKNLWLQQSVSITGPSMFIVNSSGHIVDSFIIDIQYWEEALIWFKSGGIISD